MLRLHKHNVTAALLLGVGAALAGLFEGWHCGAWLVCKLPDGPSAEASLSGQEHLQQVVVPSVPTCSAWAALSPSPHRAA